MSETKWSSVANLLRHVRVRDQVVVGCSAIRPIGPAPGPTPPGASCHPTQPTTAVLAACVRFGSRLLFDSNPMVDQFLGVALGARESLPCPIIMVTQQAASSRITPC